MQAMILAAGFGTRLLPYTNLKPKPLFPLLNTPLILLIIQRLQDSGFDHIIVNCHHLKDQISSLLNGMPGIYLQEEEKILGTGGGLRFALDQLKDEPLLITNGDIYHTVNYQQFYKKHVEKGSRITLAVHDYPRFNGLKIRSDRLLSFDKNQGADEVAFTGLHMLDPELLKPLSKDRSSCIIEWYKSLLDQGKEINVSRVDDSYWTDMGTPKDYLRLHGDLLCGIAPCWHQLQHKVLSPFYLDEYAHYGDAFEVNDWACVGRAEIGRNVSVSRSVIWDGAVVPDNSVITDRLIV